MSIITTAALTALATTLANKGLESAFENVGEKISDGAISWQEVVKGIIENSIEDNEQNLNFLKEIIQILPKDNVISNYKNVNTGSIESKGGDVQIGDNYGE